MLDFNESTMKTAMLS